MLEQIGDAPAAAVPTLDERHPLEETLAFQWHERTVRFVDVKSRPGSVGEDAILRGVSPHRLARASHVHGFAALHVPLVNALARATRRGGRVRLLLNSHFSCDLRPPMTDLIAGARRSSWCPRRGGVLHLSARGGDVRDEEARGECEAFEPKYATAGGDPETAPYKHPFTFVHAKYCVADRKRVSLGAGTRGRARVPRG